MREARADGALRIVAAQLDLLVGDVDGNCRRLCEAAEQARDEFAADCIVFPELSLLAYPPEDLLLVPAVVARAAEALERIRERVSGITVIAGLPRRVDGCLYNSAAVIADGEVLGIYDKQRLPNYGVFDELRYFRPGHRPLVVRIGGIAVGLSICEDVWRPGVIEQTVAAGAELIVNLNASPYRQGKQAERLAVIRPQLERHEVPLLYVNQVGGQDELVFDGASFVLDAAGRVRQSARAFAEDRLVVDFTRGAGGRVAPRPGRLADWPAGDEAAYEAIVLGIRDYVGKNGFPGVVIGLSGGIDSALTLALAVDALGPERVMGVLMPSRYTAAMSIEDAEAEADRLGVERHTIPIEAPFTSFLGILEPVFAGAPADVTEENIQARCRGIILMAIANKSGRMVLTTGNKSEMSVGYATLYGDMAGGFAPIKDLPKTQVYRLARLRNRRSAVIPERVLERPPSAELAPDQKDVDSLPPYEILDPILAMLIEEHRSVAEIVEAGFERAVVERVARMVQRNEYKRRQAPPGVRVSRRAFGRDRRYPVTSGWPIV